MLQRKINNLYKKNAETNGIRELIKSLGNFAAWECER
jgi:hypothetical protein